MNVSCPSCRTVFRVDPERVPVAGIKARCARCAAVFRLDRSGAVSPVTSPVTSPGAVTGAGAGVMGTDRAPETRVPAPGPVPERAVPQPAAPAPPAAQAPIAAPAAPPPPPPPVAPTPQPGSFATPAPAPVPAAAAGSSSPPSGRRPSFRNQDPGARAQRIARALVSDIVAYNKGKLKGSLDPASLRNEFREEIRKSWEEYVEQVGLDLAKTTPYFRDSLNEILAKGQKVF